MPLSMCYAALQRALLTLSGPILSGPRRCPSLFYEATQKKISRNACLLLVYVGALALQSATAQTTATPKALAAFEQQARSTVGNQVTHSGDWLQGQCGTVLPNGRTVGSYVNQLSNSINQAAANPFSTPYGPVVTDPTTVARQTYSGTNFRGMFGQGVGYSQMAFLGDAGNFAYAAVSANIGIPYQATAMAAGAYSYLYHPAGDQTGQYGMDPSASVQVPAGYGASCKGY